MNAATASPPDVRVPVTNFRLLVIGLMATTGSAATPFVLAK